MGTIDKVLDIAGMGWLGIVGVLLVGGLIVWLLWKEEQIKRERARKETDRRRIEDQADTQPMNQETEGDWDTAQDEIDDIRKSLNREPPE